MLGGQTLRNTTVIGILVEGSWITNHLRTFLRCVLIKRSLTCFKNAFNVTNRQFLDILFLCVDKVNLNI